MGDRGVRGREAAAIGRVGSGLAALLKEWPREGAVDAEGAPTSFSGTMRALAPRVIFLPAEEAGADPAARRSLRAAGWATRESSRIGACGTWIVVGR